MKDGTFKGVHWNNAQQQYRVSFTLNGKRVDGGSYDDPEMAHQVYLQMTAERNKTTLISIEPIEGEEWKPIEGYGFNGRYWVSNKGRVKNMDYRHTGQESLMTATKQVSGGYYKVHLRPRLLPVHKLVWMAFKGEIPENKEINHKDFDKSHNWFENLEVVFTRENQSHSQQKIHNKTMMGCFARKDKGTWIAQISDHGKQRYLGDFKTQEEAHDRYLQEVSAIGETNKYSYK